MGIEYRLLGRLEVLRDGEPVDLGANDSELCSPCCWCTPERAVDGSDPRRAVGRCRHSDKHNSLWVYVSGLRGALEPERAKRSEGTVLLTRSPATSLSVDPSDIDVRSSNGALTRRESSLTPIRHRPPRRLRRAGTVARACVRGVRLRGMGPGRDRSARGAPVGSDRDPGRCRSPLGARGRARLGAEGPRAPASITRWFRRVADAGPVPVRPNSGGASRVRPSPGAARRGVGGRSFAVLARSGAQILVGRRLLLDRERWRPRTDRGPV